MVLTTGYEKIGKFIQVALLSRILDFDIGHNMGQLQNLFGTNYLKFVEIKSKDLIIRYFIAIWRNREFKEQGVLQ